ncbi:MAG: acetyl-CoA carboxylase biotin carboxylase subunit [candidate division Zixibacteria bacterium]
MPKLFNKILVANRGEIAVRVLRACQTLNIKTVSVYSTADKYAVHTLMGDEACEIGPPPPLESYLNVDKIIEAAKLSGADAIHPGYGFLAENCNFAQACLDNGFVFIGPPPDAILLMGNKIESRKKMAGAGVPLIPGMKSAGNSLDEFKKVADESGYPVLIKAAAGGGGKGMRVVNDPVDLETAIDGAKREAKSAFDDDTVYLEKYIVDPRHIEFQVFADSHGNAIHVFERECSIQRRHQKIIEETPSVAVTPKLRKKMGEAAVAVTKACGYVNAGTVEFLLDKNGKFYFLEMNTRIQVEHPVTEEVVGVDLVAEQIKVASGFPLSDKFKNLSQRGHAIECRIYAEDAGNNFMPSIGKILLYREPTGPGVRVDSGVRQDSEIGIDYDPIMAKLIVWGEDRDMAIARMIKALREYKILGIKQSIKYLADIVAHEKYKSGETYTDFIDKNFADWSDDGADNIELALAAAAVINANGGQKVAFGSNRQSRKDYNPWLSIGPWRLGEKIK